jgi:hypothetical protein
MVLALMSMRAVWTSMIDVEDALLQYEVWRAMRKRATATRLLEELLLAQLLPAAAA